MNKEQYEFFKNKKVLYIIPHEDDEVNMSGGMIYWLSKVGVSTHIVFVTNGDYRTSAEIRIKEAYKSLHVLGVKEENVHFLGYSDQATHGTGHLYQSENWKSRNGMESSYIPNSITVQFGIKILQPQLFTKDNLIKDIIHVIDEIRPDIIFAVDFDSHADHRSVSLCFDAAVGKIIKNNVFYRPIIYKVFAYPTAYKGYKDFYGEILPDTKFNIEN
ncbi:MAG: PIG-L family deacetylase, partial [Oliverpabstia sp.]|nr:PIG-L family deacetylase [Oliverpabstia sp.]